LTAPPIEVRARGDDDLDALVALGAKLRAAEGYPPDSARFYDHPRLAGWVATAGDEVVGHVALHERSAEPVMELAVDVTGLAVEELAVLARLFVAIEARRHGLGRRLVDVAVADAHRRGQQPILDVNVLFEPAIGLYESCRWTRVGDVRFQYRDEGQLLEIHSYVYLGPAPPGVRLRASRGRRRQ
jgi:GNAT superfamily N-acetyltransferase